MPPDEEDQRTDPEPTEEDPPQGDDPRDARISELEAALAAATQEIDALSQGLFYAQVAATGSLVDPNALPYDASLLNDPGALQAAVATLVAASPWFAKVKVTGDVDQNTREEVTPPPVSLMGILKEFA